MLEKFKYFLKHSIIYSISNVATKASGIILLPIYTSYFTVEEFGRLGLVLAIITILIQIVVLGQNQSILKFNNQIEYVDKKKSILFTLSLFVLIIAILFIVIGEAATPWIARILGNIKDYYSALRIGIYIVVVSVINNIFQNKLRADEKSVSFTVISLIKLFVLIVATVYLVTSHELGINGVLYGQLISEIVTLIIFVPLMLRLMEFKFERNILSESLKFGLPLIFSGLSMTLLNISDRFLIKFLASEEALGLYELGYRVAGILNMFMIMPLSLTLLPVAYKVYKQPGDKDYYRKIMTYAAYLLVWGALTLSIFSKEIIELFSGSSSYLPAYKVVPVILFAYVFSGMSMISSIGIYLTSKTTYIAIITIVSAAINIFLNYLFIPVYGIMGAAVNTLIAFLVLYFLSLKISNRYYKIGFENSKLLKLFILSVIILWLAAYLSDISLLLRVILKVVIIFFFPVLLALFGYFNKKEINAISGAIKKWYNPFNWRKNLNLKEINKKEID
ncbi:MAG: oligosaccharide flippase family protein [Ignavibacteriaceae bacterium]|jgi:O-antigen/teichoic acid export membrane protein|nr:oligosaccharide flippase family protein [Ignavibacteriaceae bacterium]